MPEVEELEVDGWLLALSSLELLERAEGWGEEREGDGGVALRAGVDQGVDGLGVVGEVLGEGCVGELVAVVLDQGAPGIGDLLGLVIVEALAVVTVPTTRSRSGGGAEDGEGEEGNGAEGRHCF